MKTSATREGKFYTNGYRFMEEILINSPLFQGIQAREIRQLIENVHHQVKFYTANEIIAHEGDPCNSLQIVLSGSVRGEMTNMAGKVLKIEDIGVARPLAIAFLFGQNNRLPVTITANEEAKLLIFPKESVIKLMQSNALFLQNFLNGISNRAQFISGKLKFLSFQGLKGKLAHYLLELDRQETGRVVLEQTHEELSAIFGVARPSLTRALHELHDEEIITVQGKNITIHNRKLLSGYLVR